MSAGIRYLVVGIGSPGEPASPEDVAVLRDFLTPRVEPFVLFEPSEHACNVLTAAIIRDTVNDAARR